jgi:alkylhydroperoxidase family enzyme
VQAVLDDHLTAAITDKLRALLVFVEKVNRASTEIGPPDVERAKAEGWTDEALYDAVTVCALFNFYNVWIDATGVHDMPAQAYEVSGKRLAESGYVMEPSPKKEP